jgi:hypothetical protein
MWRFDPDATSGLIHLDQTWPDSVWKAKFFGIWVHWMGNVLYDRQGNTEHLLWLRAWHWQWRSSLCHEYDLQNTESFALHSIALCIRVSQVGTFLNSEGTLAISGIAAVAKLVGKGKLGLWHQTSKSFRKGGSWTDTTNVSVQKNWSSVMSTFHQCQRSLISFVGRF